MPHVFVLLIMLLFGTFGWSSEEVPQSLTLDGKLYANNVSNSPLLDTGTFKVQILDESATCVIYEETQTFDTRGTAGLFNMRIGEKVSAHVKRTASDSGNSLATVFANTGGTIAGKSLANGSVCAAAATAGSSRLIQITVIPDSDLTPRVMTAMELNSVPSALIAERAESLGGIAPGGFLQVNNTAPHALSQSHLENVFTTTNYSRLTDLLAGSSTSYVHAAPNGTIQAPEMTGTPSSPVAGQIWYDTGVIKYYDGSTTQALSAGSGVTSLTIGAGLTPTGTITTGGQTIAVDTGVTAGKIVQVQTGGKLPALDGSDLTNVKASSFSSTGSISTSGSVSAGTANFKNITLTNASTQTVTIQPATTITGSPLTFTWPDAMPASSGYVLSSTTGGVLSWVAQSGGGLAAVSNTASLANGKTWIGDGSGKAQEKFIGVADIRSTQAGNAQFFPTTCTAGQTLTWASGTDTMVCTNISLATSALTGTLPIANGGTGSATQNFVDLTTAQTVAGVKTWSSNAIFSGNVGIGTTSANSKLTVEGAMTLDQLSSDPTGTAGYGSLYTKTDGKLYYRDGTGTVTDLLAGGGGGSVTFPLTGSVGSASAPTYAFTGTDSDNGMYLPAADTLGFATSGAERVRIASNGNVGIGTNNPVAPLHVQGSMTIGGTWPGINMNIYNDGSDDRYLATGSAFSIWRDPSSDNALRFDAGGYGTAGDVISYVNAMNITAAGNVGIGTYAAGNAKLAVEGAIALSQQASDPAGFAAYGTLFTKTDGKLYYRDGTGTITDLLAGGGGGGSSSYSTVSETQTGEMVTTATYPAVEDMTGINSLSLSVSQGDILMISAYCSMKRTGGASYDAVYAYVLGSGPGFFSDQNALALSSLNATYEERGFSTLRYVTGNGTAILKLQVAKTAGATSGSVKDCILTAGKTSSLDTSSLWAVNGSAIHYSGNVGIGTSAPGDMLQVEGKIRATHICAVDGTNCKDLTTPWGGGGSVDLTSGVTGALPVANGGTNSSTTLNSNRLMISSGGAIVEASAMTDGQIVVGKTSSAPQIVTMSGDATISATGAVTLKNTGTAGTYAKVTTDAQGRVTAGTDYIAITDIKSTQAGNAQFFPTTCTAGQTLTWQSGTDTMVCTNISLATSALTGSIGLTSQVTGILPVANGGTNSSTTLTNNQLMVSSGGKIVEGGAMTDGQIVVGKTSNAPQIVTMSGDATISATGAVTLKNTGTAGTYAQVTTDAQGRVTSGVATLPIANGGTGSTTKNFVDLTTTQTVAGTKTWSNDAIFSGNVGIGTTSPASKLQVAGTIVSTPNVISSGATVDFSTSNTQILQAATGAAITVNNMVAGGTYTLVIQDTTSRTYTFTNCNSSKYKPANAATTAGSQSIYSILAVQNGANIDCYITWSSGYL